MRKRPSESWIEHLTSFSIKSESGCWIYKGALTWGYGTVRYKRATWRAHRLMFHLSFPEVDISDLQINHHCDNRACINPSHLYAGTQKENVEDMFRRDRAAITKGTERTTAKLTEEDIPVIRRRLESGESSYSVAKDYPVDSKVIRRIGSREKWKHVP